jgi:hypothetical protein
MKDDKAGARGAPQQDEHEPGIRVGVAIVGLVILCVVVGAVYIILFAH